MSNGRMKRTMLQKGVAIVDGGYENPVKYEYVAFREMKPKMMQKARDVYQQLTETSLDVWATLIQKYILQALLLQQQVQLQAR